MRANEFIPEGIVDQLKNAFRPKKQSASDPAPQPAAPAAPAAGPTATPGIDQNVLSKAIIRSINQINDPASLAMIGKTLSQKLKAQQTPSEPMQEPVQQPTATKSPEEIRKEKQAAAAQAAQDQMAGNQSGQQAQQAQQSQQQNPGQQQQQQNPGQQQQQQNPGQQGQQTPSAGPKKKFDTSGATDAEIKPARSAPQQPVPRLSGPTRALGMNQQAAQQPAQPAQQPPQTPKQVPRYGTAGTPQPYNVSPMKIAPMRFK